MNRAQRRWLQKQGPTFLLATVECPKCGAPHCPVCGDEGTQCPDCDEWHCDSCGIFLIPPAK